MPELHEVPFRVRGLRCKPTVPLHLIPTRRRAEGLLHAIEERVRSEPVRWIRRLPELHGEHGIFQSESAVSERTEAEARERKAWFSQKIISSKLVFSARQVLEQGLPWIRQVGQVRDASQNLMTSNTKSCFTDSWLFLNDVKLTMSSCIYLVQICDFLESTVLIQLKSEDKAGRGFEWCRWGIAGYSTFSPLTSHSIERLLPDRAIPSIPML